MKIKIIFFSIVLSLWGLLYVRATDTDCVNVYIDYGSLDNQYQLTKCITVSGNTNALDILKKANVTIEGTEKYKDAVVCRVNGLPDKSVELCKSMPPENAFWAVIIKDKKIIPLFNDWGWAQTGINEIYLSKGDSLGLVFSTNGDLKWPS